MRTSPGTTASRGHRRRRRSRGANAINGRCWRRCCWRAARRCWRWARSSATRRSATTTPMPRTIIRWLDWAATQPRLLLPWVRRLVAIRREHASLRQDRFLSGRAQRSGLDVDWRGADGHVLARADWEDPAADTLVMTLTGPGADRAALIVHRGRSPETVILPAPRDDFAWRLLADSGDDAAAERAVTTPTSPSPRAACLCLPSARYPASRSERRRPRRCSTSSPRRRHCGTMVGPDRHAPRRQRRHQARAAGGDAPAGRQRRGGQRRPGRAGRRPRPPCAAARCVGPRWPGHYRADVARSRPVSAADLVRHRARGRRHRARPLRRHRRHCGGVHSRRRAALAGLARRTSAAAGRPAPHSPRGRAGRGVPRHGGPDPLPSAAGFGAGGKAVWHCRAAVCSAPRRRPGSAISRPSPSLPRPRRAEDAAGRPQPAAHAVPRPARARQSVPAPPPIAASSTRSTSIPARPRPSPATPLPTPRSGQPSAPCWKSDLPLFRSPRPPPRRKRSPRSRRHRGCRAAWLRDLPGDCRGATGRRLAALAGGAARARCGGDGGFCRRQRRAGEVPPYLQFLADAQLEAAAARGAAAGLGLGFFRDLAVGAAPDGATPPWPCRRG